MHIREAIEEYHYAILQHSEQTQVWYQSRLNAFAEWCEDQQLSLEQVKPHTIGRYIDYLQHTPSARTGKLRSSYTVHGHARTIRTFLNWCSREEDFEQSVSERTPKKMVMPRVEHKVIDTLAPLHIKAMFAATEKEFLPHLIIRDRAILSVLLDTGIRASELPRVEKRHIATFTLAETEDLSLACTKESTPQLVVRARAIVAVLLDTGVRISELFVDPARDGREHTGLLLENVYLSEKDSYIKVTGKGRKEREIALGSKSRLYLHRYISNRGRSTSSYAFLSRTGEPLTARGAQQTIYRLAERAGVEDCHPHRFRHTFAVNYLRAGGDLYSLSRLLGHTSVQVTEVYLRSYQSEQMRQGKRISVLGEMTR